MSKEIYLSESFMNPVLISERRFDSRIDKDPEMFENVRSDYRVLNCYEFSLYLDEGKIFYVNDTEYKIHRGAWRFNKPGQIVSTLPHFVCWTLRFSLFETQDAVIHNAFLDRIPDFFYTNYYEEIMEVLQRISRYSYSIHTGAEIKRKMLLLQLLSLLQKDVNHSETVQNSEKSEITTAREYIREHLTEEVTLEQLGELCGYHPLYFLRLFRDKTGQTPHDYQIELRVSKAQMMLATTSLSVSEIAEKCGYSSVSYFNHVFKERTGETPLRYRKAAHIGY